jgi:hypothetical protein
MPGYLNIKYINSYNYFNSAEEKKYLFNKFEGMEKHVVGLTLWNIRVNLKQLENILHLTSQKVLMGASGFQTSILSGLWSTNRASMAS